MILTDEASGVFGFRCDRCGAVAVAEGVPIVFDTVDELAIVAQRDGWLGEGEDPRRDFLVCPPCQVQVFAK